MSNSGLYAELEMLSALASSLGLYDRDLAFLLDITRSYLSHIKGGRRPCDPLLVKIIALHSFLEIVDPDFSAKYSEETTETKFRKREMLKKLRIDFLKYLDTYDVTVETINDSKAN